MNQTNPLRRRMIVLVVCCVILISCVRAYAVRSNAFTMTYMSTSSSSTPQFTNPEALQNWLPLSTYTYTLARVADYIKSNGLTGNSMTLTGAVTFNPNTYDFDLLMHPANKKLGVTVLVSNFDSILSTAITINGRLQVPQIKSSQSNNTPSGQVTVTYSGFDELVAKGATASQVSELQQALTTFAPSAANMAIDTTNIAAPLDPANPTITYTFPITIDSHSYLATFRCTGFNQIQIVLVDTGTSQKVYDSGLIGSAT